MKILIFGRGAIGTQYGWAFSKAGHTVEYLVRPGRAKEYGTSLPVEIMDGRAKGAIVKEVLKTTLRETLETDHDFDLIIVSVQHYDFPTVAEFLSTRASNATILIFNNFWDEPQEQAAALPGEQCVWGFPGAAGGFPGGNLRGVLLKRVVFGTFGTQPTARDLAVRELFRNTGFNLSENSEFRGWLFIHFILNGGLHSAGLAAGSHANLFKSAQHRRNAILTMKELVPLVEARGVDLSLHKTDLALMKMPAWVGGAILGLAWKFSKVLRIATESHTMANDPIQTCVDLFRFAEEHHIPTPRLAATIAYCKATGVIS